MARTTKAPVRSGHQPENEFKRLEARLAQATKRSAFSIWLAQGSNFTSLSAVLEAHGVRWGEIANWALEEGHTGGTPITAITAKRAFEREQAKRKTILNAANMPAKTGKQPAKPPTRGAASQKRLNASDKAGASPTETKAAAGRARQTIDDIRKMMSRNDRKVPKPIY